MKKVFSIYYVVGGILVIFLGTLLLSGCCDLFGIDCDDEEPNPFEDPSVCTSPHGGVPDDCRAYSPDGLYFAQELHGYSQAALGIFDTTTEELVKIMFTPEGYGSDLKGSAWAHDSQKVASMYHKGIDANYVVVFNLADESIIKIFRFSGYYHFMAFGITDQAILLSADGTPSGIELICYLYNDECQPY